MGDLVLGISPSTKHRVLLTGYLLYLWCGPEAVRDMILADLRLAMDTGMMEGVADLCHVLRRFLDDYPEARFMPVPVCIH
jgi:hypothetical protein